MDRIIIRGARIHNLKNIDVDIPKGSFTVITGVSGSGKSSLAFDLLFEEGRRRYLQSIGLNTNAEWNENGEPYDELKGLPPAISVEQRTIRQSNPRSIVGTKTKMLEYLRWLYSIEGCYESGEQAKLEATAFSYSALAGMCVDCYGRGYVTQIDLGKIVPDMSMTLPQICNRLGEFAKKLYKFLHILGDSCGFDWYQCSFKDLPEEAKRAFLHGNGQFEGLLPFATRQMERTTRSRLVGELRMCSTSPCTACSGYRVSEVARSVRLQGKHIGELCRMSISELQVFLDSVAKGSLLSEAGVPFVNLLQSQCRKMMDVGLPYLTLLRSLPTLSGGELQRLFLMVHMQSDFDSLLYVFDEPTAGLHEAEKATLIGHLKDLTSAGNTVVVVEHDPHVIAQAEHIIEIGPGAGRYGGHVVYQGRLHDFTTSSTSLLGPSFADIKTMVKQNGTARRNVDGATPLLKLHNANLNNLSNITVSFPLGVMIGVAGKSGSGKSTLVSGSLVLLLQHALETVTDEVDEDETEEQPAIETLGRLAGWERIKKCVVVSQSPIGRTSMSAPATYVGIWDKIRDIYASLPLAAERGYTAGHFSFNTDGGACSACKGEGVELLELGPLGSMSRQCPVCKGARYKSDILEVRYGHHNIHELLNMSVSEVIPLLVEHKSITVMLKTLERVGLGYLALGQSAVTLSGGEAQRLKLARELGKSQKPKTVYVLDEPTTGLSVPDIHKLMQLLHELTDLGNTVIITEHDTSVLSQCDWIVEMGPKGGIDGGRIIAEGTPADLKENLDSIIGPYL